MSRVLFLFPRIGLSGKSAAKAQKSAGFPGTPMTYPTSIKLKTVLVFSGFCLDSLQLSYFMLEGQSSFHLTWQPSHIWQVGKSSGAGVWLASQHVYSREVPFNPNYQVPTSLIWPSSHHSQTAVQSPSGKTMTSFEFRKATNRPNAAICAS